MADQPVRTGPSQQHGQRAQLERAQQQIPLPDVRPGELAFNRPTERPSEPVTAGAPFGPGPGPAQVPGPMPDRQQDARRMAPFLPALEFMASQPSTSPEFRVWVRQLRANVVAGRLRTGGL